MFARSAHAFCLAPKTCAGCGQPFVVREGCSEAIVGRDGQLYCYATGCENEAVLPRIQPRLGLAPLAEVSRP